MRGEQEFPHKSKENLPPRTCKVLQFIVDGYIAKAEPIGSRTISKNSSLNLSPATIRNIMADLEEQGYIVQPHTSAGRIPTDEGYRFYVDSLLQLRKLNKREREVIWNQYQMVEPEIDTIMVKTSQILSMLSHQTAMVLAPRINHTILKHIEYVKISSQLLLAILVTESDIVQIRRVQTEKDISKSELDRFNPYLNSILSGLTLTEVRQKIIVEKSKEEHLKYKLTQALELSEQLLDQTDKIQKDDLYIEGKTHIFDQIGFSTPEKIKKMFATLEEKELFIEILTQTLQANPSAAKEMQVFIGSENKNQIFDDCSLIFSAYTHGDTVLGTLGVIGSTRIDYARLIPLVEYTAYVVGQLFEERKSE